MISGRKAVFLDVNGTFVNDRGAVPPSAREAVIAGRANGHKVFLCTGRSMAGLWDEILEPGFDDVIASAGGKVEYEGEVLLHRSVPVEVVRRVVEFFDRHDVQYMLEANSGVYGSRRAKERLRELAFGGVTNEDILVELLIEHAGIPREDTIGYGDGPNDLEMLRFVEIGVAMGNASPTVLDAADVVTADVDHDGILVSFRSLGLI